MQDFCSKKCISSNTPDNDDVFTIYFLTFSIIASPNMEEKEDDLYILNLNILDIFNFFYYIYTIIN